MTTDVDAGKDAAKTEIVTKTEVRHTDPFPGYEPDAEVDDFKSDPAARGDDPEAAAKAAEEKVVADKAAEEKAAADKAAEEKAAADKAAEEKAAAEKAEAEKDGDPAEDKPGKPRRVPYNRFDEVNSKRKAAEARVAELEAQIKAKDTSPAAKEAEEAGQAEIDKMEREYMDAALDGRHEDALKIRREIRAAEAKTIRAEAQQAAQAAAKTTVQVTDIESRTTAVVQDYMTRYEVFDEGSDGYDEALVDEVLALQRGYIEMGQQGDAALKKAAEMVIKVNGLKDRTAKAAPADTAAADKAAEEKAAADKAAADKVEAEKKAAELKTRGLGKKIEAANTQPANMAAGEGGAARDGSVSIFDMTDEEYDALPESKKRTMRGD